MSGPATSVDLRAALNASADVLAAAECYVATRDACYSPEGAEESTTSPPPGPSRAAVTEAYARLRAAVHAARDAL